MDDRRRQRRDAWNGDFSCEGRVAQDLTSGVVVAKRVGGDNHDCLLRGLGHTSASVVVGRIGVGEEEFGQFALPEGDYCGCGSRVGG